MNPQKNIIIIGTGPAALMAGTFLAENGCNVSFYEQKKAAARKFLVAGHGGFNLSHSKNIDEFLEMYDRKEIQEMVKVFDNQLLVQFLKKIDIPTFIGSSGKIFPEKDIKPIHVLQNWLQYLSSLGVRFFYEHRLMNFDNNIVTISENGVAMQHKFDQLILALGGASWSKTGSDGTWLKLFQEKNIPTIPFQASNAGFNIKETALFETFQGQSIKNVNCTLGNASRFGEIVFTEYGFEGAPIYYLNAAFRNGANNLKIDLKPTFSNNQIEKIISNASNITEGLKQLKLPKFAIAYLKHNSDKASFTNPKIMAQKIKSLEFSVDELRPIDEAISTVGGLSFEAVNSDLSLKKYENVYCCGEMLDWDAPTGGYLLQACFASGQWVGRNIVEK